MSLSATLYPERKRMGGDLVAVEVTQVPTVEPLEVQEVKDFLRVDSSEEDALIGRLIQGARERIEVRYGIAPVEQTLQATYIGACNYLSLPRSPAQSIEAAQIQSSSGDGAEISAQLLLTKGKRPMVGRSDGHAILRRFGQIAVTYVAGFAVGDALTYEERQAAVPEVVKQAIRLTVADWYEHRQTQVVGVSGGGARRLPETVQAILTDAGYRRYEV